MSTTYETVCVIKPDMQGERLTKITDKIKKVMSDFNVTKVTKNDWGIRKLAYPIQNFKTGQYLHFVYEGGGGLVAELERQLNYEDGILRYLTVVVRKGAKTDIKPDEFQFGKAESSEGFMHPFGSGPEGRERRQRRYDRDSNESSAKE